MSNDEDGDSVAGVEYDFDQEMVKSGILDGRIHSHPDNPAAVAEEIISDWDGKRVSWRGDFYRYTGTRWELENNEDVLREVNNGLRASLYHKIGQDGQPRLVAWSPNIGRLKNVEMQLHLQAGRPYRSEPSTGGDYVFLDNGRFNLVTGRLEPHDPKIFNLHASPFAYDPDAKCPVWDKFIQETFGGDQVRIGTHYRWMAYELSGSTALQKAYMLLGEKRSGKGTLAHVSNALIGEEQVTAMTLRQFGNQFGMQSLIGKSVCRLNDVRDGGTANGAAVEYLLNIVGGDPVQIDRKNKDPWVGQLGVRFFLASNEEVRLPDASGAIMSRFYVNRTSGSHYGSEDLSLLDKILKNEMPGVLNRVLDYVDVLWEKWPVSAYVEDTIRSMEQASQPLRAWIEDMDLKTGENYVIPVAEAYSSYRGWASENGYKPMNAATYGRSLRALLPALTIQRPKVKGEQVRVYRGLGYEM